MSVVRRALVSKLTSDMFLCAFYGDGNRERLLPVLNVRRETRSELRGDTYHVTFLDYDGVLVTQSWAENQTFTVLAPDSSSE